MPPVTRKQSKGDTSPKSTPKTTRAPLFTKAKYYNLSLTPIHIISAGVLASGVIIATLTYLVLNQIINFYEETNLADLNNFGAKLQFTFRYQVLGVTWIIFALHLVIWKRLSSGALNPLDSFERLVASQKNVLTNSVEQYIICFITQLCLICHLSARHTVQFIPLMNVFYLIGRILFWLGYPKFRTCGFLVTISPIIAANFYNLYVLGRSLLPGLA